MNASTSDLVVSLRQASELTGCSLGRFRYNRERLAELGCVVSEAGWLIPISALIEMGWLSPSDAPASPPAMTLQSALARIEELEGEVQRLSAEQSSVGGFFRRRKR